MWLTLCFSAKRTFLPKRPAASKHGRQPKPIWAVKTLRCGQQLGQPSTGVDSLPNGRQLSMGKSCCTADLMVPTSQLSEHPSHRSSRLHQLPPTQCKADEMCVWIASLYGPT